MDTFRNIVARIGTITTTYNPYVSSALVIKRKMPLFQLMGGTQFQKFNSHVEDISNICSNQHCSFSH